MAYVPTKGVFVNGRIADADEVANEFTEVAKGIQEAANAAVSESAQALQSANTYTDQKLASFNAKDVDGGTF